MLRTGDSEAPQNEKVALPFYSKTLNRAVGRSLLKLIYSGKCTQFPEETQARVLAECWLSVNKWPYEQAKRTLDSWIKANISEDALSEAQTALYGAFDAVYSVCPSRNIPSIAAAQETGNNAPGRERSTASPTSVSQLEEKLVTWTEFRDKVIPKYIRALRQRGFSEEDATKDFAWMLERPQPSYRIGKTNYLFKDYAEPDLKSSKSVDPRAAKESTPADNGMNQPSPEQEPPKQNQPDGNNRPEGPGISDKKLLETEIPELKWIVPQRLPAGFTLFAGRPKQGKSYLALQLCQAVSSGGTFFDRRVDPGFVLYVALEDGPRRLKDRLKEFRWSPNQQIRFLTFEDIKPLLKGRPVLTVIQELISELKPALTVIDTIARAMPSLPRGTDQTGKVTEIFSPVQELAVNLNSSILGIDHLKKGFSGDAIDDIMGSSAKTAVADCVWAFYRNKQSKTTTLKIIGRDLEEAELALERENSSPGFRLLGQAEEVESSRLEDVVRAGFAKLGNTATQSDIREETGLLKGTVSKIFSRLEEMGKIRRGTRNGRFKPFELVTTK